MVAGHRRGGRPRVLLFLSVGEGRARSHLVASPGVSPRLREVIRTNPLLIAEGAVQRNSRSVSVLVWGAVGMRGLEDEEV